MIDLAIIGAGPAALTAALYAARTGVQATVFERADIGGDLAKIAHISNYPGFNGAGRELAQTLREQAVNAGAKVEYGECQGIKPTAGGFGLDIDGESISAKAALIATGSEPKTLDFEIEPPVSYCALCDSDLAKGENIAVIGGGNSAVQEALLLSSVVKSLTLISHSPLKADQCLQDRLRSLSNCQIRENVEPTPDLLNTFDRVFVFIGRRPATSFLQSLDAPHLLDAEGYVLPGGGDDVHQTVIPGLFAAGDVRAHSIHQVVTAAADGAAAAIAIMQGYFGITRRH